MYKNKCKDFFESHWPNEKTEKLELKPDSLFNVKMTTRTTRSMSRQLEQLGAMPYAKKLESMEIDEVATIVS